MEVTPKGSLNGSRRYSYTQAGYLAQVESHNGASYQLQAEMTYNGLGQRLAMTAYALGQSVTTQYTLDTAWSGYPLVADADGQSTFYLYGRGAIAEKTTAWSYYLKDGQGTARQLADPSGLVTLARTFTPWGETLDQHGDGDLAWGYFGGYMDAATGLLYVGDGQYYDPATGRFLTRQPGQINPYVPGSDPLRASVGVLGLLGMLRKRKRRGKLSRLDMLALLLVVLAGGASLAACGGGSGPVGPSPTPPTQPPGDTVTPSPLPSVTPSLTPTPPPTRTAIPTLTPTFCTPTSTSTSTPALELPASGNTPAPTFSFGYGTDFYTLLDNTPGWWQKYRETSFGQQNHLWKIALAIVYYKEVYTLSDNTYRYGVEEGFSRRFWQSYKYHGTAGWYYYIGSREGVRGARLRELQRAAAEGRLESILPKETEIVPYYYERAKDIWENSDWQNGVIDSRPYEWGAPTKYYDSDRNLDESRGILSDSLAPLRKVLSSSYVCSTLDGHGGCYDADKVYYRSGIFSSTDTPVAYKIYYPDTNQLMAEVYSYAFVVTFEQVRNLCGGGSCVTGQ